MALLSNSGPGVLANFGPPPVPQPTVTLMDQGPFVDWKAKVDLFEQLRREHQFGVGTIAGVAAKFGVHRRVVRRAIASALQPPHHYAERNKPKLGAVADFIDQVLAEDCRAPRKQRHTARRIHRRILTEFPDATVAESTVRNLLVFGPEEIKTGQPREAVFPETLLPYLARYLVERHRPVLLRGEHGTVPRRIRIHTDRAFGVSLPPHWFRDAAATTIAIEDPKHVRDAHLILGHASLATTERHHNQARSLEASRRHQAMLAGLRASVKRGPIYGEDTEAHRNLWPRVNRTIRTRHSRSVSLIDLALRTARPRD
jgi:hypothetical protein